MTNRVQSLTWSSIANIREDDVKVIISAIVTGGDLATRMTVAARLEERAHAALRAVFRAEVDPK